MNLILGDCIEKMQELEENSVDTIITDPPYGLNFMGKEWDSFTNSEHDEPSPKGHYPKNRNTKGMRYSETPSNALQDFSFKWATEALRVAKPGAIMLCFGGTRTFHRIACGIEDAGWEIRNTMMWLYGSGFPKSYNIGKGIDKKAGAEREVIGRKEGERYKYDFADTSGKFVNTRDADKKQRRVDVGDLTAPATDAAKLWDGWGTALKPAFEPIIVAMKPRDGTFVENALKWGVAGLNIDGGRVPTNGEPEKQRWPSSRSYTESGIDFDNDEKKNIQITQKTGKAPTGRWPANIIHDGSEEVVSEFPQTGLSKATAGGRRKGGNAYGKYEGYNAPKEIGYLDKGSAARFFYCAKASKAERNAGLDSTEIVMVELDGRFNSINGGTEWVKEVRNLQLLVDTERSLVKVIGASMTEEDTEWNTLLFGNDITGVLCPTDIVFITKMGTSSITKSETLNALIRLLTKESTLDVRFEKANGGSHAANVGKSSQSLSFTSESTVYLPGVGSVASGTRWKISVSEENGNANRPGKLTCFHPTVKPLSLMEYLCRLTATPTGGVVLDPFMGSGTTGMACRKIGREFIGIELDEHYFEIAEKRIASVKQQELL